MYILTIEDLLARLDEDLAWRRKELTEIKFLICSSPHGNLQINLRIGVVMIYAHWEGFIKNAGDYYINYLSQQNFSYKDVNNSLIALSLKAQFKECGKADKTSVHCKIVNTLINELNSQINIPYENAVKRKENLNYELLSDLLFTLGLEASYYELKENLIDHVLLKTRNDIAHGRRIKVDLEDFIELYVGVIPMLEQFKTQIFDAAEKELYKKSNCVPAAITISSDSPR